MKKNILRSMAIALLLLFEIAFSQTVTDFVSVPNPDDLEMDSHGNLWVNYKSQSEPPTWHLAKITPDGTLTNIISEDFELGQFGINDDFIWIAGPWGPEAIVYKYDHNGVQLDNISMQFPTEIILEPDGTWYITQNAIGRLTKVFSNNTTQIIASGLPLNYNLSLARDENGMFYTCNLGNSLVIKINPNTSVKTILTTLPSAAPYSLGFLSYYDGFLYVPSFRHCIYKVDTTTGSYTLYAGTDNVAGDTNGEINVAQFNNPIATAISNDGTTLFVTDSGNGKIKKITGINPLNIIENDLDKKKVNLYPNPTRDKIIIELSDKNKVMKYLDLYSVEGKKIEVADLNNAVNLSVFEYNTSKLQAGNYIFRVTMSDDIVVNKKFIIN